MTGTAGHGRRIGGLLLPPRLRIRLVVALYASTAWALLALLGRSALGGVLGGLTGGLLATVLFSRLDGTTREERHAVSAALREHRDPGLRYREAVTREARILLAARPVDRWLPLVLLVGLTGAGDEP